MESKSPQDCFAQFDAAFAEWSAELQPSEARAAVSDPPTPAAPLPPGYSAADYEAFDRIDVLLARAGGASDTSGIADSAARASATAAPPIELWKPRDEHASPLERVLGTVENLVLIRGVVAGTRELDEVNRTAVMRVLQDARDLCDEFVRHLRYDSLAPETAAPKIARAKRHHSVELRVAAVAADRKRKKI